MTLSGPVLASCSPSQRGIRLNESLVTGKQVKFGVRLQRVYVGHKLNM